MTKKTQKPAGNELLPPSGKRTRKVAIVGVVPPGQAIEDARKAEMVFMERTVYGFSRTAGDPPPEATPGQENAPAVLARAHARGDAEIEADFARWLERIELGQTERYAARGIAPVTTIRSWMDTRPEYQERLRDAVEVEIQRRLDESDDLPLSIGSGKTDEDAASGGIHPKAAELKIKQNNWRLGWLDQERFGPKLRTELTGKDGGAIKQEHQVRGLIRVPPSKLRGGE